MACYDIVVDFKWALTYLMISNLRMACYDIGVDLEWTIDFYNDL